MLYSEWDRFADGEYARSCEEEDQRTAIAQSTDALSESERRVGRTTSTRVEDPF